MDLEIELRPLTQYDASFLGRILHVIVTDPRNSRLVTDFPQVPSLYSNKTAAVKAIKKAQAEMGRRLDFAALAVEIGAKGVLKRVFGMATINRCQIPGLGLMGPRLDIWLDAGRPGAIRNIGAELLAARLGWIKRRPAFKGNVWSAIRADHPVANQPWQNCNLLSFCHYRCSHDTGSGEQILQRVWVSRRPVHS